MDDEEEDDEEDGDSDGDSDVDEGGAVRRGASAMGEEERKKAEDEPCAPGGHDVGTDVAHGSAPAPGAAAAGGAPDSDPSSWADPVELL